MAKQYTYGVDMIKGPPGIHIRMKKIDSNGDPLVLKQMVDWEAFRSELETPHSPQTGPHAGRKLYDVILIFNTILY